MSATLSDLITETANGGNPVVTTVQSPRNIGGSTLVAQSLEYWPTNTKVHFQTYQLNSAGAKIVQTDWNAIVSGSNLNNLTYRGGALDSGNSVGDYIEMMPTYSWAQDLAQALELQHLTTGAHHAINNTGGLTTDTATVTGNETVGGTLGVTGVATLASLVLNGSLTGTGLGSQVQSQANAGTAGGNMWWVNLGGIKQLWFASTSATTAGTTYTITFPTFFTTVQAVLEGVIGSGGTTTGLYIVTASITNSGFSFYSGTNPIGAYFLVIGT